MNNEQLENSLREEIDNYVRIAFAQMQDDIVQLQNTVSAEIQKHQTQVEEKFKELVAQAGQKSALEPSFVRVVTEHLRVAHEDGEKAMSDAFAKEQLSREEAENQLASERAARELAEQNHAQSMISAKPAADYIILRDAINDISSQTSQSEILKSLVGHASDFAPRGAFFIVKGDKLVGWRTFGSERAGADDVIRGIALAATSDTLPATAIKRAATQHGEHGEDAKFLEDLGFSVPEKMIAIPLIVRGRGVAVLYADSTADNSAVQIEALESLVRVASLTVELMASAKGAPSGARPATPPPPVANTEKPVQVAEKPVARDEFQYAKQIKVETAAPETASGFAPKNFQEETPAQKSEVSGFTPPFQDTPDDGSKSANQFDYSAPKPAASAFTDFGMPPMNPVNAEISAPFQPDFEKPAQTPFSPPNPYAEAVAVKEEPFVAEAGENFAANDFAPTARTDGYQEFDAKSFKPPVINTPPVETAAAPGFSPAIAPPVTTSPLDEATVSAQTVPPRRFGDRSIDLPIEVSEEERRSHNDARRFARLLVSEIKLYNEAKVKEGRQSSDLYDRLKEAIDRSREMYDKRVAAPVVSKFDYFHYELVNTLAEGNSSKLGADYPGATV